MKKNTKNYEAPHLTVAVFRVERGFAGSGDNMVMSAHQKIQEFVDQQELIHAGQLDANGNVVASDMAGSEDYTNVGNSSNWQYSNGGWF